MTFVLFIVRSLKRLLELNYIFDISEHHVSDKKKITQAKIKSVKMMVVIVGNYLICWTPFFVTQMIIAWKGQDISNSIRNYCSIFLNVILK